MLEVITIIVLLVFGLFLIFAEVLFIPGTTIAGFLGLFFSGGGIYLTFTHYGQLAGWIVLISNVMFLTWSIIYGLKSNVWKKFTLQSKIESKFNLENRLLLKIGDVGVTVSDLRPIGNAEFNERVVEVKSLGNFIKSGTKVKVIKLEANYIFVETLTNLNI